MSYDPDKNTPDTYVCFFDGSCRPYNPGGMMGQGVVIRKGNKEATYSAAQPAKPGNTNNVSEYLAFKMILKRFINRKDCKIRIYGDSNMVISQMTGEFKIKSGSYVEHALECEKLLADIIENNDVRLFWIPREKNTQADALSQNAVTT